MITWQRGRSCTLHYPLISSLQSPNTHFLFADRVAWSKIVRGWGEVRERTHYFSSPHGKVLWQNFSFRNGVPELVCLRGLLWLLNSSQSLLWAASSLWNHWNPIQMHWSWVYLASRSFQGLLPPMFLPGNVKKTNNSRSAMCVHIYDSCCHACWYPVENDSFLYRRVELFFKTEVRGHLYNTVKECMRKRVFAVLCSEVMGHFRGSFGHVLSSSLHS